MNEESASSCGWDILSQAVLGASCSKFCDANEEATAPSLHRTDLCGEMSLPKKKSPKPQLLKSVSSGALRGKSLPKDPPSDSFISYRIADVKSADQVALEAGNSPSIIFKHYRELTTDEQAEKWFSIMPKEGQCENTLSYDRKKRRVTLPDSDAS